MKTLINSPLMKWFRKLFLEKIYNDILERKETYCCRVKSWHSIFICWKDLKEVKENMNSKQLVYWSSYTCNLCWFENRINRLDFLKECIKKF